MSDRGHSSMQDIALAVEMIVRSDDSARLTDALRVAHEQGRLADVTAALVMVGSALVDRLAVAEGRTIESLTDEIRVRLMQAVPNKVGAAADAGGEPVGPDEVEGLNSA